MGMKAAELVAEVEGLNGRVDVWSWVLEKLNADVLSKEEAIDRPPQVRSAKEEHIQEVADEISTHIDTLKSALDDLLDKDVS